jgi:hypothetical protein
MCVRPADHLALLALAALPSTTQMGVLVPGGDRTAVKRTADFFLSQFTERLEAQVRLFALLLCGRQAAGVCACVCDAPSLPAVLTT